MISLLEAPYDYIRRWVAVGQTIQAFTNIPVLCQHQ